MDSHQPRRIFLQRALTTIGVSLSAGAVAAILTSCEKDESITQPPPPDGGIKIKISDYPSLTGPGSIVTDSIPGLNNGNGVFISQVGVEVFAVFTTVCTHAGCSVSLPAGAGQDCICPCHGSRYSSTDGKVKLGPAPSNLRTFAATFNAASGILSVQP